MVRIFAFSHFEMQKLFLCCLLFFFWKRYFKKERMLMRGMRARVQEVTNKNNKILNKNKNSKERRGREEGFFYHNF